MSIAHLSSQLLHCTDASSCTAVVVSQRAAHLASLSSFTGPLPVTCAFIRSRLRYLPAILLLPLPSAQSPAQLDPSPSPPIATASLRASSVHCEGCRVLSVCVTMSGSPSVTASLAPPPPVYVCVLGCTGVVGQKFLSLLQGHPYFRIACLCASERSAGRPYEEAVSWKLSSPIPSAVRSLLVQPCDVKHPLAANATVVFSALDPSVAGPPHAHTHTPLTRTAHLPARTPLTPLPLPLRCCGGGR